jgi:endonuclease YncB( thermonuclease family)
MKMRGTTKRMTVGRYLAGRRVRGWGMVAGAVCLLGTLAWMDRQGYLLYRGSDRTRYQDKEFEVLRVISGDRIEIGPLGVARLPAQARAFRGISRGTTVVHLCGIMTPQPGGHHGAKIGALGQQAVELAGKMAAGGPVRLDLAGDNNGAADQAVRAYVFLADGKCLNVALLEAGLARCDGSFHARGAEFAEAERQGRWRRAGMWSDWHGDEDDGRPAGVDGSAEDDAGK